MLPAILLLSALLATAVMAFGTHPSWALWDGGLGIICVARRLQWPLAIAALGFSAAVIGLVASGKRKAWWLIALAPVVALFLHRFTAQASGAAQVRDNPDFVGQRDADFLRDDDMVVGLVFSGNAYAYPYALLYKSPVVIQSDREQRMMLVWSPFANRAVAVNISREVRARELEIVSMPANGTLLYNRLIGQFISGITMHDPRTNETPSGIGRPIETFKVPWRQWRDWHPQTRILAPLVQGGSKGPGGVLKPYHPMPPADGAAPDEPILVVFTPEPLALPMGNMIDEPLNMISGGVPIVLIRDPVTRQIRAFDRRLEDDLIPRFTRNRDPNRKGAYMIDGDTLSGWTARGVAVDGSTELSGTRLTEVPMDQNLYWGVMKYWYPELQLIWD